MLLHLKRPRRALAAFVGICYVWLSALLSFQHTDCLHHDAEALLSVSGASVHAGAAAPLHTQIAAAARQPVSTHCAACEWQAANVSVALPVVAVDFVPPPSPRIITTFPRYLHLPEFPHSSRAPPLA